MKLINYLRKNINVEITSRSNEKIKCLKKLQNKSFRDDCSLFIIEGTKLFEEAFQNELVFKQIFVTNKWLEAYNEKPMKEISGNFDQASVFLLEDELLKYASGMQKSEGIICVLEKITNQKSDFKTYVLLEDVQDPNNLGAIIRTADAAGIDCVITTKKSADIYNEKVLRSSMGSVFHIPIIQTDSLESTIIAMKNKSIKIIGTALSGENLWEREKISSPYAIIFGNESKGLSVETQKLCDLLLKIPIPGQAESLNVSVAVGIIIYDLLRTN